MIFNLWPRTKIIRQKLERNNEPTPTPDETIVGPLKDELIEVKYLFQISQKAVYPEMPHNRIQIFAPEVGGSFHTVTSLALYQKRLLDTEYSVTTFLAPYSETPHQSNFDVLLRPPVKENCLGTSIYHLGNHPSSLLILTHFLLNSSNKKIIVLHDLNLVNLAMIYCDQQYGNYTFFRYIQNKLGIFGAVALRNLFNGLEMHSVEKRVLVNTILAEILSHADAVICHQDLIQYQGELDNEVMSKLHLMDLPIGYFSRSSTHQEFAKDSHRIVISGHSGGAKQLSKVVRAVCQTMDEDSRISCFVLGGVCTDVSRTLFELELNQAYPEKFTFTQQLDDIDWENLHRTCSLGIRLGVGANGESSGLVRDYLYFGLKVITNENSRIMQSNSSVSVVDSDIDVNSLSIQIQKVLNSEQLPQLTRDYDTLDKIYLEKLKRIIDGLENEK